ncbi:uncharacterized protein Fot_18649 [Forsythia ovata]|uniref:Uncharacterized protein n=1 Tax=Forsythia ovata TaxID=205694 RepID=A0ABD1VKU7_9LAMI
MAIKNLKFSGERSSKSRLHLPCNCASQRRWQPSTSPFTTFRPRQQPATSHNPPLTAGKAATVIKGKRLHGFMLNIFFNLLGLIVVQGYRIILGEKGLLNLTIYGLFMMVFSSLGNLFLSVAYTVLYFQCKKIHGEEIELYRSIEYTKLYGSIEYTKLGLDFCDCHLSATVLG